jgi:hypothetical protein
MPECYQEMLTCLEQDIEPEQATNAIYKEQQFSMTNQLGVDEVATFLASAGMTTIETEQWQPWVAAYVDMELKAHLNSMYALMLEEAQGLVQSRITKDPKWVLASIHSSASGYFNPQHVQHQTSRGSCRSCGKACQTEEDSMTKHRGWPIMHQQKQQHLALCPPR